MSRRPVDKLRPDQTRQAIWDWIRTNRMQLPFTIRDVNVDMEISTIRDYLNGLAKAGFLEVCRPNKWTAVSYTLVKDNGQEAPRVRRDGTVVTQGLPREQLWRALGIFAQKGRIFTVRDLTLFASTAEIAVAETDAQRYCSTLLATGYLNIVKAGVSGSPTQYRMPFGKWTGPRPVQIQRTHRCYDPNTGAVAHLAVISVEGGE